MNHFSYVKYSEWCIENEKMRVGLSEYNDVVSFLKDASIRRKEEQEEEE